VMQRHALPMPVTSVEMTEPPDTAPPHDEVAVKAGLRHTELFAHVLDQEQIAFLASRSKVVEFARESTLMRQGESASSMYIILEGAARITLASGEGEPQEVAVLATGDIVGEMSLMTGSNRSATVTALTRLRTLEITKEPMAELLQKSPELLSRFSQVLTQRQEELNALSHRTLYKAPDVKDVMTRMKEFFSHVLD
jgi:CRP-like cAMP-binding protein